ncbi:hypothetical protein [Kitasatospora sp. NPDC094011]|uniref:hypothetical protein n=1 Tax=Kitasatospora sp. NPDC094011 TaxID=3364090 RepID=UPI00381D6E56
MSGDAPFTRHDGTVVLLLFLLCAVATPWLATRGTRALLRARKAGAQAMALACGPALGWAAACGLYAWGLLRLGMADDYTENMACNEVLGSRLVGFDPSFLPLEFGCVGADGRTVPVIVPSYLNPALAVLVTCAVTLTVLKIVRSKEKTT